MNRRRIATGVGLLVCAVVGTTLVGAASSNAAPGSTVISAPAATGGWVNGGGAETSPAYVAGPAGADGNGSLKFSTPTPTDHVDYYQPVNVPLLGVSGLSYKMNSSGGPQASYQLQICAGGLPGGACSGYTTLVYEPYQNGGSLVGDGAWHTFADLEAATFWSTHPIPGNGGSSVNQIQTPLSTITAANPHAVVIAYGISQGSNNPGSTSFVDDVAFNGVTTNFEYALNPTITTAPNLTVYQTSAAGAAVPFTVPTATDPNSGHSLPVACTPGSNSVFGLGVTTVTCSATSPSGPSVSTSFTITVLKLSTVCQGLPLDDKGYLQAHPNYGANAPATPCVASTYDSIGVGPLTLVPGIPLLHINPVAVNVAALHGVTGSLATPGLAQSSANSTVAGVSITAPGLTIQAHGLYAQASATLSGGLCTDGITTGNSTIAALDINGKSIVVGRAPITIKLGLVDIYINQTIRVGNTITQRALYVDILSHSTYITAGQAVAGVSCVH